MSPTETEGIVVLQKGQKVQLRADDPDSVFTVTSGHVEWNQTNHITGKQLLIVEIEMEREVPGHEAVHAG